MRPRVMAHRRRHPGPDRTRVHHTLFSGADPSSIVYAYRVAYDGRDFHGFQRQPDVPTVEGAIATALRELDLLDEDRIGDDRPDGEGTAGNPTDPGASGTRGENRTPTLPDTYSAAGRTDAGVSALAQTVAFDAPEWLTPHALGGPLPDAVRVWARAAVPADFDARYDATRREYVYFLPVAGDEFDVTSMREAAARCRGTHDFRDLSADDERTERTIECAIREERECLAVTVAAGGFPRELVRRLVTVLAAVGRGELALETVEELLEPGTVPDHVRPGPAPPGGLVLSEVAYPGITFVVDAAALEGRRAAFRERWRRDLARARVGRFIAEGP